MWCGCIHCVHEQETCYFIILVVHLIVTNMALLCFDLCVMHAYLLSYFRLSQYFVLPFVIFFLFELNALSNIACDISLDKLCDHCFHFPMLRFADVLHPSSCTSGHRLKNRPLLLESYNSYSKSYGSY